MHYLNSSELSQFHDSLLSMFQKHAVATSEEEWGYPGGIHFCDTYSFNTKHGLLYIGHDDLIDKKRWWIPVGLEERNSVEQLPISFEICIPKIHNMFVSVHYTIDDHNIIHILHKGKFTVGYGSVSMDDFFKYYRANPGNWQVINFNYRDYLELGRVHLVLTDADFIGLLDSLADFANYIPDFKIKYR